MEYNSPNLQVGQVMDIYEFIAANSPKPPDPDE